MWNNMDSEAVKIYEKVYIQYLCDDGSENPEPTWCQDKINNNDIEYILKSQAAQYCEVCRKCLSVSFVVPNCPDCHGAGLVLKDGK